MIQFDEHIFPMGWFNHQLDNVSPDFAHFLSLRTTKNDWMKCA